jgi:hypothetical protein
MNQENIDSVFHVDQDSRPLCNQNVWVRHLWKADEFRQLSAGQRCQRCDLILAYGGFINTMSDNQIRLVSEIRDKISGEIWYPAADLCHGKTVSGWASFSRSLRRLVARGFIQRKRDKHNRVFVRLKQNRIQ